MNIVSRSKEKEKIVTGNYLILVAGNIAAGKSTLCSRLSNDLSVPFMEINNMFDINTNCLIVESTGLGYRTDNLKRSFKNTFIIKCQTDKEQTHINIKSRDKQFKPHEIKMNMDEYTFYEYCKDDIDKLKSDAIYDYRETDYLSILNQLKTYT